MSDATLIQNTGKNSRSLEIDQSELKRIKENVESSREYFKSNYDRYNRSRKFLFKSAMDDAEIGTLQRMNKPPVEFNIGEAYVSRLLGEFSQQEPSFECTAKADAKIDMPLLQFVEAHLRNQISEANQQGWEYNSYKKTLSGGFTAWKVWTDFEHPYSFDEVIRFDEVFDPTLVGFDILARNPTKSDGRYSYELFPKTKEDMQAMGVDVGNIKFVDENSGFHWAYRNGKKEIILLCDYYEKVMKKVKIVKLADGSIIRMKEYNELLKRYELEGRIEQPPAIIATRMTNMTTIVRYLFTRDKIIAKEKTDFEHLPHIFVDGNSNLLRENESAPVEQVCRGYTYNLHGAQKLKNFAGQALAGELQNIVQHKWIVAKEAIPQDYADAYIDAQVASTLVYNHLYNNDTAVTLPPPREVARTPIPPQITETFNMMDNLSQTILGSYDASLGINRNQLSGVAIENGATQSNSAAMPYIVSYMHALNQLCTVFVTLMPKVYRTPRTMPVTLANGRKGYVDINQKNSIYVNFNPSSINVSVKAGVNFAIQKARAMQELDMLGKSFQVFGQFINEKGLKMIVDNLDIKGSDELKEMAQEYMDEIAQAKQAAANQQSPEQQMLQLRQKQLEQGDRKNQIEASKVGVQEYEAETARMTAEMKAHLSANEIAVKEAKSAAENIRSASELAIAEAQHHHDKAMDIAKHHHEVNKHNANMSHHEST